MGLKKIASAWKRCKACPLHVGRRKVVFGECYGSGEGPRAIIIGEAPGAIEDEDGRPFVGQTGQLLREVYLKPAGVDNAFITHAVCCKPARNRKPTKPELDACFPRLSEIVAAFDPQLVVVVGRMAEETWSMVSGVAHIQVYHPTYILKKGWPSKEARALAKSQAKKIKDGLAAVTAKLEDFAGLPSVPVEAGEFFFEGSRLASIYVDPNTAEFASKLPRKPPRRRKK